jgi:hypothetical protein
MIQDGINTYIVDDKVLIPWSRPNTYTLYFQSRYISTGQVWDLFPHVVSTDATSSCDFSVSPFGGPYSTSGVVVYQESYNIFARAYWITQPYKDEKQESLPKTKDLSITAYPNPFNPVTSISVSIPHDGYVTATVYNMLGQNVQTLVNNEFKKQGVHTVTFNGENFPSGVYFVRVSGPDEQKFYKLLLVK